jgi:hypothetical protein
MKWREGRKSMRRPSDQRKSCEEGVSTAASSVSRVLASIALDLFSEAEGIIFNVRGYRIERITVIRSN